MKTWAAIFTVAGVLALGYWAFETGRAGLFQKRESARLAALSPATPNPSTEPGPEPPRAARVYPAYGAAFATLAVPRLGLSTVVLEGAGRRQLSLGSAHIRGTALPGEGGNVGVAGHRDTVFRPLRRIQVRDMLTIALRGREYRYRVVSTRIVQPDAVDVLRAQGRETLTLVTCYPFDFVGSAPGRFIVQAECENCLDVAVASR